MRIGAPIFVKTANPDELARAHVERGYRASYCRLGPNATPEQVRAYREAFAKHDVVIAEANAMCISLLDTDEANRQKVIKRISDTLAFSDRIGAKCCAIHGGTVQANGWGKFTPENFSKESFGKMVATIQEILDKVQPKTAKLAIEIEPYTLPDTPQAYRHMIDAVNRPGLGVHFDPVNSILSPRTLAESGAWLREYFERVGPWIVSCHAKELVFTRDGEVASRWGFKEVPPGQGFLDYDTFIKGVSALPLDPPVMIEHLKSEEQYAAARDFILGVSKRVGVKVLQ
jgi:sugar phosphate isomerase/epimerase